MTGAGDAPPGATKEPSWNWLAAPLVLGIGLRLYRVDAQPLTGDELHLLNAVIERSLVEIATQWTRFGADYGVPLALFFRSLSDLGLVLGERALRAPMLLCSVVLLIAAPRLLAPSIGRRAALALAWLLALSPLLVLYGRMVRSYSLVVLFAFLALMAFRRFSRGATPRRSGAAYALLAALCIWLHLPAAPLVLAPLALAFTRTVVARWRGLAPPHALGTLAALGAATAALIALFLLPAAASLSKLGAIHGEGAVPGLAAWWEVLRLHSGTRLWPLTLVAMVLGVRGARALTRRDRELAILLGGCSVLHVAGLLALGPDQLDNPIVINRYLLTLLPFSLALVALGATEPWAPAAPRVQRAACASLAAVLFATGPLATREFRTSSFVHASTFVRFTEPGNRVEAAALPQSYEWVAATGRRDPVIEYPWSNVASHAFDAYQKHHGLPVLFGSYGDAFGDARVAARNTVVGQARALLASRGGFVVVHRDLEEEESRVLTNDPHHWRRLRDVREIWRPLQRFGPEMDQHLRRLWGPPDADDGRSAVWDLERVRRAARSD